MDSGTDILEAAKERAVSAAGSLSFLLVARAIIGAPTAVAWPLKARRTYLRDVATAAASSRADKS